MRILRSKVYKVRGGLVRNPMGFLVRERPEFYRLMSGARVVDQGHRPEVLGEFTGAEIGQFELFDGHLSGHRPIVGAMTAAQWVAANPGQCAEIVV